MSVSRTAGEHDSLRGDGGFTIPYSGYDEVSLRIPQFLVYQEDVLMLIILDSKFT